MKRLMWSAGAFLVLSNPASAGPLERSLVPSEVGWVVHLDAEAALKSSLGRFMLDNRARFELDKLDEVRAQTGIDPLSDIYGLTVFGTGDDGEDAVAIVATSAAVDRTIDLLREKGQAPATIREGGYDLYAWVDKGNMQYGLVRKAGEDRRLVYISRDKGRLIEAAEVGAGRGAALGERAGSALAASPGPGAILFIASDVIPTRGQDPNASVILSKARAVRCEVGESDGRVYGHMTLTTASSEDATSVVQIAQGLLALGRMLMQSDPELAKVRALADSVQVTAREATVSMRASFPAADLIEAVDAAKRKEEAGKVKDDGDEDSDKDGGTGGPL